MAAKRATPRQARELYPTPEGWKPGPGPADVLHLPLPDWLRWHIRLLRRVEALEEALQLAPEAPKLLTVKQVAAGILPVPESQLRNWIFSDYEGFATACVTRRGSRVFIHRERLLDWLDDPAHW